MAVKGVCCSCPIPFELLGCWEPQFCPISAGPGEHGQSWPENHSFCPSLLFLDSQVSFGLMEMAQPGDFICWSFLVPLVLTVNPKIHVSLCLQSSLTPLGEKRDFRGLRARGRTWLGILLYCLILARPILFNSRAHFVCVCVCAGVPVPLYA